MLQGSSALQYESQKQITTPSIKVTLKDGSRFIGQSQMWGNYLFDDGIEFKDFYLMVGSTGHALGSTAASRISVVTMEKNGLSTLAFTNFSTFTAGGYGSAGKFLSTGETLMLFTRGSSGNGLNIVYSSGGTAWGSTEVVSSGASITVCQPTGSTRVYGVVDTITAPSGSNGGVILNVFNKVGGTWNGSTLVYGQYKDRPSTLERKLVGKTVDNEDILLMLTGIRDGEGIYGDDSLLMIRADGYNSYGVKELIPATTVQGVSRFTQVDISNLGVGMSDNFLAVYTEVTTVSNGTQGAETKLMIHRSQDMIHWSSGELLSTGNSIARIISLIAGATIGNRSELILHAGVSQWQFVTRGLSSLDLSPYIQSYSNNNNERISLTLGNMQ